MDIQRRPSSRWHWPIVMTFHFMEAPASHLRFHTRGLTATLWQCANALPGGGFFMCSLLLHSWFVFNCSARAFNVDCSDVEYAFMRRRCSETGLLCGHVLLCFTTVWTYRIFFLIAPGNLCYWQSILESTKITTSWAVMVADYTKGLCYCCHDPSRWLYVENKNKWAILSLAKKGACVCDISVLIQACR